MKKSIMILLAAGLAAGVLAGCGSDGSSSTTDMASDLTVSSEVVSGEGSQVSELESGASESSTPSSDTSAVSSAVSSSVSSAASKPTSSATPSKPASSTVSSKPASSKPATSSTASSKPAASTTTPQQICKAIASAYGDDYYPDGEMPAEYIYGRFPVDTSLVDTVYGEMAMISVNPDQVVVMKAKSGKGAQLETAMKNARDKYVADAQIYPKDIAKLNASRVVRSGDYVAFLMVGAIDEVNDDITTDAAQKFAQDQIAIGVRAFQNAAK